MQLMLQSTTLGLSFHNAPYTTAHLGTGTLILGFALYYEMWKLVLYLAALAALRPQFFL
jgi:hypothetical protein